MLLFLFGPNVVAALIVARISKHKFTYIESVSVYVDVCLRLRSFYATLDSNNNCKCMQISECNIGCWKTIFIVNF